jgi:O-antigen/teichoic acid export membrane protein
MRGRAFELGCVLLGKLCLVGANAALMLFLARRYPPSSYGLLVAGIGAQLLLSRALLLGVESGMKRLRTVRELREVADTVVRAGFATVLGAGAVAVLATIRPTVTAARTGARLWPGWELGSITAGGLGTALLDYCYAVRLAHLRYRSAAALHGGSALLRMVVTVGVSLLVSYRIAPAFIAYSVCNLATGAVAAFWLYPRKRMSWAPPLLPLISRLVRYSVWQAASNFLAIAYLYQGTFLLLHFGNQQGAGRYGLALTLSLGFFAIYNASTEFLLPRAVQVRDRQGVARFLRRSFAVVSALAAACLVLVGAVVLLVEVWLGPGHRAALPVFLLLSATLILLLFQCPFEAISHVLLRPDLLATSWLARAALVAIGGIILVPQAGAMGAATAQLIGTVAMLVPLPMIVLRTRWYSRHVIAAGLTGAAGDALEPHEVVARSS